MKFIITAILLLFCMSCFAFKATCNNTGNLYYPNEDIIIKTDTNNSINYSIVDYYGNKIKDGSFSNTIKIKLKDPSWYIMTLNDGSSTQELYISVILNKLKKNNKQIVTDAAASWLVPKEDLEKFVKIIAKSNVGGVRERLSWNEFQPTNNKEFLLTKYDYSYDLYKKYNVDLYQINHSDPDWAKISKDKSGVEDLRNVYNFHKQLAKQYPYISAFEVWNEPDISFWPDVSDKMSSYIKAGYLGIKAGNPKALGLGVSMCIGGNSPFYKNLLQDGYIEYADRFNWHAYTDPENYSAILKTYLDNMKSAGYQPKPSWISEAGIRVEAQKDSFNSLNNGTMRLQCEFVPVSGILSLATGNERNYFFVAPSYLENGIQFGLMKSDFNLYPGFAALSTTAYFLNNAKYLGRYLDENNPNAECRIFRDNNKIIATAWGEGKIVLPTNQTISIYNIFGKENRVTTNKSLSLTLGKELVYVTGLDKSILSKLTSPPINTAKAVETSPSKTIISGYLKEDYSKEIDFYMIQGEKKFTYNLDVYNFDENNTSKGTINIALPDKWYSKDKTSLNIELKPMERKHFEIEVKADEITTGINKIKTTGKFNGRDISPCVTPFKLDLSLLGTSNELMLPFDEALLNTVPGSNLSITKVDGEANTYIFDVTFKDGVDRWSYPYINIDGKTAQKYQAFAVDVEFLTDSPNTSVKTLFGTTDGSMYMGSGYNGNKNGTYIYLFEDVNRHVMDAVKPFDFKPENISKISFGINGDSNHVKFKFKNPRLCNLGK